MTRGSLPADQRRPQQRRLADDLEIVGKLTTLASTASNSDSSAAFRQRLGQPLQMGLIVAEQHRFLGRKVPEEGPLGYAGVPASCVTVTLAKPLRANRATATRRSASWVASALLVQVEGHGMSADGTQRILSVPTSIMSVLTYCWRARSAHD